MTAEDTLWGKVYGSLFVHPKWLQTPAEGRALWVSSLSYCISSASDGDVPEIVLPILTAPGADVATGVQQLLDIGLWVRADKGYRFHDWACFQQTVDERKKEREKKSQAGKASAEARRRARSEQEGNAPATDVGTDVAKPTSTRSTEKRREEQKKEGKSAQERARSVDPPTADGAFDRFWAVYPKKVAKKEALIRWKAAIKTSDPEQIIRGAARYAQKCEAERTDKKFIKQPDGWLNAGRWEDEIEIPRPRSTFDPWDPSSYQEDAA